jgi:hypothetical protein
VGEFAGGGGGGEEAEMCVYTYIWEEVEVAQECLFLRKRIGREREREGGEGERERKGGEFIVSFIRNILHKHANTAPFNSNQGPFPHSQKPLTCIETLDLHCQRRPKPNGTRFTSSTAPMDALDIIINADITSSTMLRWEQERGYQTRNSEGKEQLRAIVLDA